MVGTMERAFRKAIRHNVIVIGRQILCPICQSLVNKNGEIAALNSFFAQLKKLETKPPSLSVPSVLGEIGIFKMDISLEAHRTHSRTVWFLDNFAKGAEISDITILVTHELIEPTATTLIDKKISFFQAKIDKKNQNDVFDIPLRQWHLMRYFPVFRYGGDLFDLSSCRMVPDVCSYYMLLFGKKRFNNVIYGTPISDRYSCNINSVCASAPNMERWMPELRGITDKELIADSSINLTYSEQGDRFFALLWFLLSTHLGAHEPKGIRLFKAMFADTSEDDDPTHINDSEPRPAIGLRIRVGLRSEGYG